jgi:hypothetical protein
LIKFGSHPFPDFDSIVSTWLYKRFVIKDEEYEFFITGNDKLKDEAVLIDIGLGEYDHHQYIGECSNCNHPIEIPHKNQICPHCNEVKLTNANIDLISAAHVIAKKHSLDFLGCDNLAIRANQVDSVMVNNMKPGDLFYVIRGLNEIYSHGFKKVYEIVWKILDKMHEKGYFVDDKYEVDNKVLSGHEDIEVIEKAIDTGAEKEAQVKILVENSYKFTALLETENGKKVSVPALAAETDLNMSYSSHGKDFVLYVYKNPSNGIAGYNSRNPGKGDLGIPEVDLTNIYNTIKTIEPNERAEWYLHWSKRLLLCGSKKRDFGKEKATELSLQQLIELVKKK